VASGSGDGSGGLMQVLLAKMLKDSPPA